MSLIAQCAACSQQFQADPACAGQTLACPSCGGVVQVPMPNQQLPTQGVGGQGIQQQSPFGQQTPQTAFQQQSYQQPAAQQQGMQSNWQQPQVARATHASQPIGEQSNGQVVMERIGWALSSVGLLSLFFPLFGLQIRRLARLEEMVGGAMPFISLVLGLIGVGLVFGGKMYHRQHAFIFSGSMLGAILLGFVLNLTVVDRSGATIADNGINNVPSPVPANSSIQDAMDHANEQMQQNLDRMNEVADQMMQDNGGFSGGSPFGNQNNANNNTGPKEQPADSQPFRRPVPVGRKSGLVGSVGGSENVALALTGKRLMGVSGSDGSWGGKTRLARFQPYIFPGPAPRGKYTDKAKPGYAVGAIEVNSDSYINAVRCTYVKVTASGADWSDSYEGEWIGTPSGNEVKKYGGQGEPAIIGLYFRQGLVLNALGVVFED